MLAALLATWLTQHAQFRTEVRRERAAAAAEHRQANRQLYMDALKLADRLRDRVGAWAIVASLYCQGSSADEVPDSDRWKRMRAATEDLEKQVADVGGEAGGMLTMLRTSGASQVAHCFGALIDAVKVNAPTSALPLPGKTYASLRSLPADDLPASIGAVDHHTEEAVSELIAAVSAVLATDVLRASR
ncbi:hypothetical protein [Curtobacterium flaccumfaciens]|uniref:hypothetical protein n=1 Tax=Curtobacterium flaccumfaciens TaxID=2035 RepID=UPI001BDEEBD2|nr:hypothetical protein [Curtobacterium flaccumfaciens]MBT1606484.1 hypothetical protein [Curtobacterium flaccumfaciens pv. betae]MBT1655958.1 hypothetical protein [Curtobacterium flaccumfaciens pv. betae]MCS0471728.1 hypothetical protein [Curtobacterium flaccumfaciens pv. betae]MCS0473483.1 hypothetical protein [Curtobacterium flaccumfaciens pv. betae]MCS0477828.1 hypothetical protein [Curtobacterium flaccumfaciens pv. betae]